MNTPGTVAFICTSFYGLVFKPVKYLPCSYIKFSILTDQKIEPDVNFQGNQFNKLYICINFVDQETRESSPKVTQLGNFKLKMEDDCESISIGSMFAKRKEKTAVTMTGE